MAKQFNDLTEHEPKRKAMRNLTIILDPGHGENTAGKRSPDGRHREYKWARERCAELEKELTRLGFEVHYTNPHEEDMSNTARVHAADSVPGKYKLMLSIHNNAAGDGTEWLNATGWGVYTTKGDTKSDDFAKILEQSFIADFPELFWRGKKEANFTVLTGKSYWAVLIEWMMQDSKKDLAIIENPDFNRRYIKAVTDAVEIFDTILNN